MRKRVRTVRALGLGASVAISMGGATTAKAADGDAEMHQRNELVPSRQVELRPLGITPFPQINFFRRDPWKSEIGYWLERERPTLMITLATLLAGKPPWQRKPLAPNTIAVRPWLGAAGSRAFLGFRGSF